MYGTEHCIGHLLWKDLKHILNHCLEILLSAGEKCNIRSGNRCIQATEYHLFQKTHHTRIIWFLRKIG